MITVCAWKWKRDGVEVFGPEYVNTLRAMLERHLHLDHELVCVTDDPRGLDGDIRVVPMPDRFAHTPRCRRRMQQYSRDFSEALGSRLLVIDLDVVIVGDITPIVNRPEPIVCWKVRHAGVFSGSFVLYSARALHQAYLQFALDPEGYPRSIQQTGVPSDQAMLNAFLSCCRPPIPYWTEADGFVTYYGAGYERLEHLGVGPNHRDLPPNARIVVLGSADKAVLERGEFDWVRRHWTTEQRTACS